MSAPPYAASPTTLSVAVATAILGAVAGYLFGAGSSLGFTRGGASSPAPRKSWPNSYDVTVHPDSSDEELMAQLGKEKRAVEEEEEEDESSDETAVGELKAFADVPGECKLVLVVRNDLGMRKGKAAFDLLFAKLERLHFPQAKLLRNAPMPLWPVTGDSTTIQLARSCYGDGSVTRKQRLQSSVTAKKRCSRSRHKHSA